MEITVTELTADLISCAITAGAVAGVLLLFVLHCGTRD